MYRPRRQWAWNEAAEKVYEEKRARLAEQGHVTDEEVCALFLAKGITGFEPQDVKPAMMDAICESPLEAVLRSLSLNRPGFPRHFPGSVNVAFQTLPVTAGC